MGCLKSVQMTAQMTSFIAVTSNLTRSEVVMAGRVWCRARVVDLSLNDHFIITFGIRCKTSRQNTRADFQHNTPVTSLTTRHTIRGLSLLERRTAFTSRSGLPSYSSLHSFRSFSSCLAVPPGAAMQQGIIIVHAYRPTRTLGLI